MNRRLAMLTELVESGKADAFARYALALEHRKEGRNEVALEVFGALRRDEPDYLPMYFIAGRLLMDLGRDAEARGWLEAGLKVAEGKGDGKTLRELEAALSEL
ncbi:MAG: tetratricopeptide repeat protein [Polyangiaceae bacterium]|nr:tetratricopeptide repeat protein [Polyangiaceae bacterium]